MRQRAGLILYVVLWASGFIPSRILVQDISPLWGAVVRLAVAGSILLALAILCKRSWPTARDWCFVAAIGIATNVVYLGLLYIALRHLTSGTAAIIASTNPLMLALVAPMLLRERSSRRQSIGLVVGFGGDVAIMSLRAGSHVDGAADELLALASVAGLVTSTILFKRASFTTSLSVVTALQLSIGAIVLFPIAFAMEGPPSPHFHLGSVLALAYLVLVMSIGASLLWFWLLARGSASRLSAYHYVTPVLGLLLSRLLLGEPLVPSDIVGAAIVAVGIALVQRGPSR